MVSIKALPLRSMFASLLLTQRFPASFSLLSVSQESSVQEEVEMMVESLLDVLLQTLLSIMSKSHSVETSRGQRCPQCTAEITVSFHSTCNKNRWKLMNLLTLLNVCSHLSVFFSCRGSTFPVSSLCSDR